MSQHDPQPPATQADIQRLQSTLTQHDEQFRVLIQLIHDKADETMRHFDVIAEDLKHDFQGIFKDRQEQQSDRLLSLEHRLSRVERALQLQ